MCGNAEELAWAGTRTRKLTHTHTFTPHAGNNHCSRPCDQFPFSHLPFWRQEVTEGFPDGTDTPFPDCCWHGAGWCGSPKLSKQPCGLTRTPWGAKRGTEGLMGGVWWWPGEKALDTRILSSPVSGARVGEAKLPHSRRAVFSAWAAWEASVLVTHMGPPARRHCLHLQAGCSRERCFQEPVWTDHIHLWPWQLGKVGMGGDLLWPRPRRP